MRSSDGAGGEYLKFILSKKLDVNINECKNYNVYSRRCKFAAIDRYYDIIIPKSGYIRLIGGILTYTKTKNRRSKCSFFVQDRGLSFHAEKGYIINNYHVKSSDAKNIKQATEYVLKIRLNAFEKQRKSELKLHKEVTFADSLRAGNCKVGSLNFCNKYGLNTDKSYTMRYLLSIANESERYFVKRIR